MEDAVLDTVVACPKEDGSAPAVETLKDVAVYSDVAVEAEARLISPLERIPTSLPFSITGNDRM